METENLNQNKCDDGINLRALKQIDDSIDDIIQFGGQVAVYKYSFAINEWERKEIEGSMFIISRKGAPNHAFVVINRLNTTNMYQTITNNLDTKLQVPYLLYKNAMNEIYCIWFYNEDDCAHVYEKIVQLMTPEINLKKGLNKLIRVIKNDEHQPQHQTQPLIHQTEQSINNNNTQTKHEMQIFQRLLSVELNSCDNHKMQQTNQIDNGIQMGPQSQLQSQTPVQTPQKRLQVQDLFNSQMAALSITPQDINHYNFNEEVLTPAMLSDKTKAKQNDINVINADQNSLSISGHALTKPITTSLAHNIPLEKPRSMQMLTMEQLKQTLVYLLQNDADFLHTIHTAYTASLFCKK